MLRDQVPLRFPCGADFDQMKAIDDRRRLCAACDTVVADLSAMTEADAKRALAARETARLCVRYLYDARTGEIAFAGTGDVSGATIVPAHSLASRIKRRAALAAALAAPLVLLEACGGADGYGGLRTLDAGADAERIVADAAIGDAPRDAAGDAGTDAGGDAVRPTPDGGADAGAD